MKSIKVIKKDAVSNLGKRLETNEENKPPPNSKSRQTVKTIESWIAEWRSQTENETRRTLEHLNGLKMTNSKGT